MMKHNIQSNRRQSPLIMVVDDFALDRQMICSFLTQNGYEVIEAENGHQAIAILQSGKRPDLILLDILMPGLNGYEVCKMINELPTSEETPIVMITGSDETSIIDNSFDAGAEDYVIKPINWNVLGRRLSVLLEKRQLAKSLIRYNKQLESLVAAKTVELNEKMNQLEEANLALERIASQDGLTGIPNRRHFDNAIAKEWRRASRAQTTLSLIIADIDYFKLYNDSYGHLIGDKCLKTIAQEFLHIAKRPGDTAARFGGEEFVLLLPDTTEDQAFLVAQNLYNNIIALQVPHSNSQVAPCITLSFGVASIVPDQNTIPEALIAAADQALYQAKEEGRNKIVIFCNK